MDDSSKIALGIIGAAFLLGAMYIGYREYDRRRDIQEVQEARNRCLRRRMCQGCPSTRVLRLN